MQAFAGLTGPLVAALRAKRKWSRGQLARRLSVSPAVLYNLESGRSRVTITFFARLVTACGLDPAVILRRHLFSIQQLQRIDPAELVQLFRARLKVSQKELAARLGYRSAAMVHHFEKGIRQPSLEDLFNLMVLGGDDLRGFVLELTGEAELAKNFPAGEARVEQEWEEYWRDYYIAAVRQIMRTDAYGKLGRYRPGYFARLLGISDDEERHALAVLGRLNVIRWEQGKPCVDPSIKILIPHGIQTSVLNEFKSSWLDFARRRYLAQSDGGLFSIDLLPVSRKLFEAIVKKVRRLQDEIHNLELDETDGFACLGWLGGFVPTVPDQAAR